MENAKNFDGVSFYPVDNDVVRVDHHFSSTTDSTNPVQVGMARQIRCGVLDELGHFISGDFAVIADVVEDFGELFSGLLGDLSRNPRKFRQPLNMRSPQRTGKILCQDCEASG